MVKIRAKQNQRYIAASVPVSAFSANGGSGTVTTAISTALSTAGDGGGSVPVQVLSYPGEGIITSGTNNRVEIVDATTKEKIDDGSGNEVYGRLTESGGVYTLTYYKLVAGVETAHSFGGATSIDFEFGYCFSFENFPYDALVGQRSRLVYQDPQVAASGARMWIEIRTPTAQDTIPDLTKTPTDADQVFLFINGQMHDSQSGGSFTIATRAITWNAANAGFNVETTDRVIAQYWTAE